MVLSDLHLESDAQQYRPVVVQNEQDINLMLPGDICEIDKLNKIAAFLEDMSVRFKNVVYVLGNHEFYNGHLIRSVDKLKERVKDLKNVHILVNDCVNIDGVNVIGATLWTNFNKGDPMAMWDAERNMRDYKKIKIGNYSRLKANDVLGQHIKSLAYIRQKLVEFAGQRNIVMSHHAPTVLSISSDHRNDPLNPAYVSELSEFIYEHNPSVWIHGHVHQSFDYDMHGCRVICNPRGYAWMGKPENPGFCDDKVFDLS